MGARKDIEAASAYVRLYTKGAEWSKGLAKHSKELDGFGKKINGMAKKIAIAGGAIAAPLVASVMKFTEVGTQLDRTAKKTGMTVESLSELEFAAEKTGSEFSTLEGAIQSTQAKLSSAAAGNIEAQVAFAKLGLSFAMLRKMKPDQVLESVVDALLKFPNLADRIAVGSEIMGGGITELMPLFANGSKGMEDLRKQARDLGIVMDTQTAESAAKLSEAFSTVSKVIRSLVTVIGSKLAAPVLKVAAWVSKIVQVTRDWIDANGETVRWVAALAAGLFLAAAAAFTMGGAIQFVGLSLFSLSVITKAISGAMMLIGKIGVMAFAAITSPAGIAVGVILGLATAVAWASGALATMGEGWVALSNIAGEAWGGIVAAVMAGDLALAGEIAMSALAVAWSQVTTTMREAWNQFTQFLVDTWTYAVDGVTDYLVAGFYAMETAWTHIVGAIKNAWSVLTLSLTSMWDVFISYASEAAFQFAAFFQQLWADLVAIVDQEASDKMTTAIHQSKIQRKNEKDQRQKDLDAKLDANMQGAAKDVVQNEKDKAARLDAIQQQREAMKRTLNEDRARREDKRQEPNADLEAKKKELAAKRKELQGLTNKAKEAKAPEGFEIPNLDFSGLSVAERSVSKVSATGIFSGFGVRALGGDGGTLNKIAKATEKTAKNTEDLDTTKETFT